MAELRHSLPKQFNGAPSILVPGLGQAIQGDWKRGIAVFLLVATAFLTTLWYGSPGWYIIPILLWAWNIWDAMKLPQGAPIILAALSWLIMAYGIGWQVTNIDPLALFQNTNRATSIIRPMLKPDFITERKEVKKGWVDFELPCSTSRPAADHTIDGIRVSATPGCGKIYDQVTVTVEGLWANTDGTLTWLTPINGIAKVFPFTTDADGKAIIQFIIPLDAMAGAVDPNISLMHRLSIEQDRPIGGIELSSNGKYVIQGIYETLALALLATTLGAILALPFGFLAARNLMGGNPVTLFIYFIVRGILNIIRSIEALIMAIIFVVIVGLGPFPGMLAITVHTIAALGKLYSEVIEGIDPGPIEAVRATGANWIQVVQYAVIPQIVPPFTALTIYRWDINLRSSTIIGLVGGGGIGFFLYQWILIGDYHAVSSSFIAIAVVVIILDFFSARLRERIH